MALYKHIIGFYNYYTITFSLKTVFLIVIENSEIELENTILCMILFLTIFSFLVHFFCVIFVAANYNFDILSRGWIRN